MRTITKLIQESTYTNITLIVLLGSENTNDSPLSGLISDRVSIKYLGAPTMVKSIMALRKYLKINDLDVIQSMIRGSNYVLLLGTIGIKDFAIVLREANIIYLPIDSFIKKLQTAIILNILYRRADAVICNCKHASISLTKSLWFFKKPLITLSNPVLRKKYFQEQFVSQIHEKRKKNTILCVARHNKQKDIAVLLLAFKDLQKKRPYASLTIIGEGPLLNYNKNLAEKLGISNNTRFVDRLRPLDQAYLKCETFVLPSKWEGMPNSMVEALAFGMKVVSFKSLGCTSTLVDIGNGNIATSRTSESLARALDNSLKRGFPKQQSRLADLLQFEFSTATVQFVKLYHQIKRM